MKNKKIKAYYSREHRYLNDSEITDDTYCDCNTKITVLQKRLARKYHINISALLRDSLEREITLRERIQSKLYVVNNDNTASDYDNAILSDNNADNINNDDNDGGVTNV